MKTTTAAARRIEYVQALKDRAASPGEVAACERALERLRATAAAAEAAGDDWDGHWYGTRALGSRYAETAGLDIVELGRVIRQDLKLARRLATATVAPGAVAVPDPIGDAPAGVTFRVFTRRGTMCDDHLSVQIVGHDHAWGWELHEDHPDYGRITLHTPAMAALVEAVEGIVAAYNYNGSDSQVDHFDVRFYSNVSAG